MPKERSINPAQAQRKAEKAKAIKKGKAEAASRRNEKLARKNPQRLQKQLDDLKAISESGGKLTSHEAKVLEELERDLKAVKKARELLGESAPVFNRGARNDGSGRGVQDSARGGSVLGKRRRGEEWRQDDASDDSDVPEDVKGIPMPRDTPPPIPREVMDRWHQARRERNGQSSQPRQQGTSANSVPLGANARGFGGAESKDADGIAAPKVVAEAKTVYEAAPAIRDLRKEAVSAFVPAAVRLKLEKAKGVGGLVEPEEADRLEKEGYMGSESARQGAKGTGKQVELEEVEDDGD